MRICWIFRFKALLASPGWVVLFLLFFSAHLKTNLLFIFFLPGKRVPGEMEFCWEVVGNLSLGIVGNFAGDQVLLNGLKVTRECVTTPSTLGENNVLFYRFGV
ncbi:hypothetical protein CEXT_188581 [Caerostris extrusa]|uniref:Secreted protein n=1 Tax=Caerostris extrusa TaxID=172846 RepID=A0AAV4X293_CAEEX|nr:hypothetical protein CEXT_188581 [Caerostris extrusa]